MFKRITSILLALMLVLGLTATAFAGESLDYDDMELDVSPADDDQVISFDTKTAVGWKDFDWVGFHIWSIDDEDFAGYSWGAKKQRGTDDDGDGIWSYDLAAAGLELKDDRTYAVIFYNNNWAQTYNLLFGTECYGHTAYCDGTVYENPEDSNKTTQAAFWEDIDPREYGPELKITSIGNVVGTCCPAGMSVFDVFSNFLFDTLGNARTYSGKNDQQIIDDIGKGLDLTLEEVAEFIAEYFRVIVIEWDAEESTIPSMYDPEKIYVNYTYYFDNNSGHLLLEDMNKGDEINLMILAAAEKPIKSLKGYIDFDFTGLDVIGATPFADDDPYFTATTITDDNIPGRTYFEIDLIDGADYIADGKTYYEEGYSEFDDEGNEIPIYELKGLDLATIDLEVITDTPGVYNCSCVLTDAVDVDGKVLMENGEYNVDEFVCDTNFAGDDEEEIYQRGDADMDGSVTIMDATRIQRLLAGLAFEDEIDFYAADADSDGSVTVMDATRIQRVLAGLCDIDGNILG